MPDKKHQQQCHQEDKACHRKPASSNIKIGQIGDKYNIQQRMHQDGSDPHQQLVHSFNGFYQSKIQETQNIRNMM